LERDIFVTAGFVIGEKWSKVCWVGKIFGEEADMGSRKFWISAAAAIALCAGALGQQPATAPAAGTGEYDVKREGEVVGTVVAYAGNSKTAPFGARMTVQTSAGVIEVHLGDPRLLAANHFSIATGDTLRIVGESLATGNANLFVARIVQKGTQALAVRTSRGFPIPYVAPAGSQSAAARRGVA
jgi:hypothetical protein